MLKKFSAFFVGLLVLCVLSYVGIWLYSAEKLNNVLSEFYERANDGDLQLYTVPPKITGFPFTPRATFREGLKYKGIDFIFEEMDVEGFAIYGLPVTLTFPEGLQIGIQNQPNLVTFSHLELSLSAPNGVPELYEEDLAEWHTVGGAIDINHYEATLGSLEVSGDGIIALGQNLQPLISLSASATGYEELLASLEANGNLNKATRATALLALDAVANTDPESGVKTLNIPVVVQYQKLIIGPLELFEFPEIHWDRRTPLDRLQ